MLGVSSMPSDKSVYLKIVFLIFLPKQRDSSSDNTKHIFKLMDEKIVSPIPLLLAYKK